MSAKLKSAIDTINIQKNAQIAAVLESDLTEKEKAARIQAINLASDLKINQTRLDIENLTAVERSNIELALIQGRENQAISSEERILAKRQESLSLFESSAQQVFAAIGNLNQARTNNELKQA